MNTPLTDMSTRHSDSTEWRVLLMLRKSCEAPSIKLLDGETGGFVGYASTFGNVDRSKEAVQKGAFLDTLEAFKRDGFIAIGHDWGSMPVGTISEAKEDDHGLLITTEFHSTAEAQDARRTTMERLARGKSVGLSIGYRVLSSSKGEGEGVKNLDKIELHEVSLVTVPCNPLATVGGVKNGDLAPTVESADYWLTSTTGTGTGTGGIAFNYAKDRPLAGLPMAEHSEKALAVLEEFVARVKDLSDLRANEDRHLSDTHRQRLMVVEKAVAELLRTSAPVADMSATMAAFADAQRTLARLNGVRR